MHVNPRINSFRDWYVTKCEKMVIEAYQNQGKCLVDCEIQK